MRKVGDGEKKEKKKEKRKKKKKRMAFLVATTSLPAVYRPNGYARTTTAGTPHARAKNQVNGLKYISAQTNFGSEETFLSKEILVSKSFSNKNIVGLKKC